MLTGSSGRIGRAIAGTLAAEHDVIGVDRIPSPTTHITADITDRAMMERAIAGAHAVIHTAGLHAPHIGIAPDRAFEEINVEATAMIADLARHAGVARLVFTSTTALYGRAIPGDACTWIDETTEPSPRTIYHRTKLAAETLLRSAAGRGLTVRVLRMARCFPEPANVMAAYRLHRGVDARDVCAAHAAALTDTNGPFGCHIISARTPFHRSDCATLAVDAPTALAKRAPDLVEAYRLRDWPLPRTIDRVYDSTAAEKALGWQARYGFTDVLDALDRRSVDVLPASEPPPVR